MAKQINLQFRFPIAINPSNPQELNVLIPTSPDAQPLVAISHPDVITEFELSKSEQAKMLEAANEAALKAIVIVE